MTDVFMAIKSLNFIKRESISDISIYKDSYITKTLGDLYYIDFGNVEDCLKIVYVWLRALSEGIWVEDKGKMIHIDRSDLYLKHYSTGGFILMCEKEKTAFIDIDYLKLFWLREDKSE